MRKVRLVPFLVLAFAVVVSAVSTPRPAESADSENLWWNLPPSNVYETYGGKTQEGIRVNYGWAVPNAVGQKSLVKVRAYIWVSAGPQGWIAEKYLIGVYWPNGTPDAYEDSDSVDVWRGGGQTPSSFLPGTYTVQIQIEAYYGSETVPPGTMLTYSSNWEDITIIDYP